MATISGALRNEGPSADPARDSFEVRIEGEEPARSLDSFQRQEGAAASREQPLGTDQLGGAAPRALAGPTSQELERAFKQVSIVMYVTSWCPHCKRARAWFEHNRIRFIEHDVDRDTKANLRYRALNPKGGVPTIDIDGAVLVGFGEEHTASVLRAAAEKRARRLN